MYDRASYNQGSPVAQKQVLAGGTPTTRKITIAEGEVLDEGSVLGLILAASAATVTVGAPLSGTGGTVGNGAPGAWTVDAGAPAGNWYLEITAESANAGKFKVVRPDGTIDGIGTVAVAYNGQLNGTLADGTNDWKVGDIIPISVSYDVTELEHKLSAAAATDGSQVPDVVLATAVDATDGPVEALAYETAHLAGSGLTLGAGHTLASIREGLRVKGLTIA